jgi:TonB family protein
MKISLSFLLVVNCSVLFAQQKNGVVITRDTINISGYVYNNDGTPCAKAVLISRQRDTVYYAFNLTTITDKNGFFKLNGAKFNDTISVTGGRGDQFFNKGSRYMVLYIVPRKIDIPIEVTAHRIKAKPLVKFTVKSLPHGFYDTEFEPSYPGGINRYRDAIVKKLAYPQKAVENNIEGIVEIGFTVLKDGTTNNYKVLKGLGYGCEDEVIQIMKGIPKWKPGLMSGRAVDTNFMIDVEFKLTDD